MTRFELATPTLARLCATTAPHPHFYVPSDSSRCPSAMTILSRPVTKAVAGLSGRRRRHGRLAQLVARFLHTEEVVGSSPASPTRKTADQRPVLPRKRVTSRQLLRPQHPHFTHVLFSSTPPPPGQERPPHRPDRCRKAPRKCRGSLQRTRAPAFAGSPLRVRQPG